MMMLKPLDRQERLRLSVRDVWHVCGYGSRLCWLDVQVKCVKGSRTEGVIKESDQRDRYEPRQPFSSPSERGDQGRFKMAPGS